MLILKIQNKKFLRWLEGVAIREGDVEEVEAKCVGRFTWPDHQRLHPGKMFDKISQKLLVNTVNKIWTFLISEMKRTDGNCCRRTRRKCCRALLGHHAR